MYLLTIYKYMDILQLQPDHHITQNVDILSTDNYLRTESLNSDGQ